MSCMEPRERQAQAKSCTSIAKISTKNQNRRKAMSELQKIRIRMKTYSAADREGSRYYHQSGP